MEILLGEPVSKFQKMWLAKLTFCTYQGCSEEIWIFKLDDTQALSPFS